MIFHYSLRSCGEFCQCPQEIKKKTTNNFHAVPFPISPHMLSQYSKRKETDFPTSHIDEQTGVLFT